MTASRLLVVGVALLVFAACGGGGGDDGTGGEEFVPEAEVEEEEDAGGTGSVDRDAACSEFLDITTDFTLDDAESASALNDLASRTSDPELAGAIEGVADAFARHDPAIYSTEVDALCG